jgi:FMN phosphatase YigB (HAD superfamily)
MKNDRPCCLLFDLGNVIVDLDLTATTRALEALAGQRKEEFRHFLRSERWMERYEKGAFDDDTFLEGIRAYTGGNTAADEIREAWNAMLLAIPVERLHWLADLRKSYEVALLSNTNGIHLAWVHDYLDRHYGMKTYEAYCFDHAFYSHRIGRRKPEPDCYRLVLETLGKAPGEVLFIDDVRENTLAAEELGIRVATHPVGAEIMDRLERYVEQVSGNPK